MTQITQMNFAYNMPISSLWRTVLVRMGSVLLLGVCCSGTAWAQSWADNMFAIKSHNFGNVLLLSDTQHSFVFHNNTGQDVRIASATSSCGCSEVLVPVRTIKSGEKGEIIAKINTGGQHTKNKSATITVTFDRPSTAHVQLEVAVYIRPDIVLNPGAINFGTVREGQKITKTVQLQYAGNPNWGLVRIDRTNPYIHAVAKQLKNPGNSREITYNIQITLSDKAPAGEIRDILRFVTNDQNSVAIELPVSGSVMDALVAKPSPFQFGSIAPGETVTKYLVLRASQPFRVKSVRCPGDRRFIFSPSDQISSVHIVAATLTSRQEHAESVAKTIYVETTLEDQGRLQIPIYAHFLSAEDVNFNEHYAPQWKSQILASQNQGTTRNRPRPLPSRPEEWDDLPINPKTLDNTTQVEVFDEEETPGILLLDVPQTVPVEDGVMQNEIGILTHQTNADPKEYPPSIRIDDLNTQDWVPLAESREMNGNDASLVSTEENDWRPRAALNRPEIQSLPPLSAMPKSTGKIRFGTPQKLSVTEGSESLTHEGNQGTNQETTDDTPKRIVGGPPSNPKVIMRQEVKGNH